MKVVSALVAAGALALAAVAPAAAAEIPAGGLTIREVAKWLQDAGYKAELKSGDRGSSYIRSAAEGTNFSIFLYDCKAERCASLQFYAAFDKDKPMDLKVVNAWNRDSRFLKAYLDEEGDPVIEYDASVSPGGTYEALDDDFAVWTASLGKFKTHIGW